MWYIDMLPSDSSVNRNCTLKKEIIFKKGNAIQEKRVELPFDKVIVSGDDRLWVMTKKTQEKPICCV